MFAYTWREALELRRDPIRATLAIIGSVILMLVIGILPNTFLNSFDQSSARVLARVRSVSTVATGDGARELNHKDTKITKKDTTMNDRADAALAQD